MSSISGLSSGYQSTTMSVDFIDKNRYRVVNQDQDGDGVVDGKSLAGDEGKVVNESTLNQMLAARGLKAANGNFQSVDGFALTSTNAAAVSTFGSDPVLPNVGGPSASASALRGQIDFFDTTKGLDDAALMWMVLSTMATTAMRDVQDATQIKRAMQEGKLNAKEAEISATAAKIAAERSAVVQSFVFAVSAAVVSTMASVMAEGQGPVARGLAGASHDVISKFGEMLSKTSGPKAEADRQEIRQKVADMQQQIMDMAIDEAKSTYDESKELMRNALKAINDHIDRQAQVTQAITRS